MASSLFAMDQNDPLNRSSFSQEQSQIVSNEQIVDLWKYTKNQYFTQSYFDRKIGEIFLSIDEKAIQAIKTTVENKSFMEGLPSFLFAESSNAAKICLKNPDILTDEELLKVMLSELQRKETFFRASKGSYDHSTSAYHDLKLDARPELFDKKAISDFFSYYAADLRFPYARDRKPLDKVQANILINALEQLTRSEREYLLDPKIIKEILTKRSQPKSRYDTVESKDDISEYDMLVQRSLIKLKTIKILLADDINLIKEWAAHSLKNASSNEDEVDGIRRFEFTYNLLELCKREDSPALLGTDFIKEIYQTLISAPRYDHLEAGVIGAIIGKKDIFEIFTADEILKELERHKSKARAENSEYNWGKLSDCLKSLFNRQNVPPFLKKWLGKFILEGYTSNRSIADILKASNAAEIINQDELIELLMKPCFSAYIVDVIADSYNEYNIGFSNVEQRFKDRLNTYLMEINLNSFRRKDVIRILKFRHIMEIITPETLTRLWNESNDIELLNGIRQLARVNRIVLPHRPDLNNYGNRLVWGEKESVMNVDMNYFEDRKEELSKRNQSLFQNMEHIKEHIDSYIQSCPDDETSKSLLKDALRKQITRLGQTEAGTKLSWLNIVISKIESGYSKEEIRKRWSTFLSFYKGILSSNGSSIVPTQSCSPDRWAIYALRVVDDSDNNLNSEAFWYTEKARLLMETAGEERNNNTHIFDKANEMYKGTVSYDFNQNYFDYLLEDLNGYTNSDEKYAKSLIDRLDACLQEPIIQDGEEHQSIEKRIEYTEERIRELYRSVRPVNDENAFTHEDALSSIIRQVVEEDGLTPEEAAIFVRNSIQSLSHIYKEINSIQEPVAEPVLADPAMPAPAPLALPSMGSWNADKVIGEYRRLCSASVNSTHEEAVSSIENRIKRENREKTEEEIQEYVRQSIGSLGARIILERLNTDGIDDQARRYIREMYARQAHG